MTKPNSKFKINNIALQALTPTEAKARFELGANLNAVLNHDTVIYQATADILDSSPHCQFSGVLTVFFVVDKLTDEIMVANLGTSYLQINGDHESHTATLFTSHISAYEQALPLFINAISDELDIDIHRVPVSSIALNHDPKLGVTMMYQSTWELENLPA